jgi:hypothetical protein
MLHTTTNSALLSSEADLRRFFLVNLILAMIIASLAMQPYEDFVLSAYLWLLLGVLFRLPTLAVSAQYAAIQPTMPIRRPGMI